ncbi:histidinol-phosphate transaminase [Shimazuella sp. AN120528]|nr:histidinol-phosphate transaminase [Shimazuella soli]
MRSKRSVQNLPVYQAGKPIEEVQREYGWQDVIKLVSNENPVGCSPKVIEALKDLHLLHHYPEPLAPVLRNKLADHLNIKPQKLIFGNGSSELIQMICRAFLEPKDESILVDFTYSIYQSEVKIEGAIPIIVPLQNGVYDLEAMYQAITSKTKIIWICNPNNPTGALIDHETLRVFLARIPKNILVVLDEAYIEYVTDLRCPDSLTLSAEFKQLLILRTFSKIYGLAAVRMGYAIADKTIIDVLHRVRPSFNTNRYAQHAAIAAIDDQSFVTHWRTVNHQERNKIMEQLDSWGLHYYPTHANFILIDTGLPSHEVFQFFLERGIIIRDRLKYPTYIRVTVGTPEQNRRFLAVFAELLSS